MSPFALLDFPYASLLTGKTADFEFSDLYARVADKTGISKYSNDVVIVSIDGCSRDSLSKIIDTLDNKGVSVIGIDILFKTAYKNDSTLVNSINKAQSKVVLAVRLEERDEEIFKIIDRPYFYDSITKPYIGAVNFPSYSVHGVIRSFKPSFYLGDESNQTSISHFSSEIVKQYSPTSYDALKQRENDNAEPIKFHQNNIDEFSWLDIMNHHNINLSGKIVIIGYTLDINDLKSTPTGDDMPGIYIHAKTIQTILDGSYVTISSTWWNKTIALFVSFCFVWILLYLSGLANIGNLIGRIIQIVLLILIAVIGINIFINKNHYIDTFYTVLCIGLSQVCFDIINGVAHIYSRVKIREK